MYRPQIMPRGDQPLDESLLPPNKFIWQEGDKFVTDNLSSPSEEIRAEVVGETTMLVMCGAMEVCDLLEVTYNGWVIPCYRIKSEENVYCVCQNYAYKAVKE